MYELLLSIHILATVVFVGGGVAMTVLGLRMSPPDRIVVAPHFAWYGSKVIPAAAGVLLLAGIGLVVKLDLSVTEPWVLIGIVLWVATAAIGGGLLGPLGEKINAAAAAGDTATADAAYERLLFISRIDSLVVLLAVVDMAAKPG
jgi:hypothetical protein